MPPPRQLQPVLASRTHSAWSKRYFLSEGLGSRWVIAVDVEGGYGKRKAVSAQKNSLLLLVDLFQPIHELSAVLICMGRWLLDQQQPSALNRSFTTKCLPYSSLMVEQQCRSNTLSINYIINMAFEAAIVSRPDDTAEYVWGSSVIRQIMAVIVLVLLWTVVYGEKLSALRLGSDSSNNDMSLTYAADVSEYMLQFSTLTDNVQSSTPFALCFRLRPVATDTTTVCSLTNTTGSYDCLGLQVSQQNSVVTASFSKWKLSSDFTTKSDLVSFDPTIKVFGSSYDSVTLSMSGDVNGQKFSFMGKADSVFEVVSSGSFDFYGVSVKRNYVSSFYQTYGDVSDNLFMQRQALCYVSNNIVNLLFVGAVSRGDQSLYCVALINYHLNSTDFLMWGGLSFARDKVLRDMLGFVPSTGSFIDLYSLYAAAPFLDTSLNVNGTEDWTLMASSDNIRSGSAGSFYYTQVYRKFDTGDTKGDEVIMYKINNQYCFAAYFTTSSDATLTVTNEDLMHQILECFTPDLTIGHPHTLLPLLTLLGLLLLQ